MLENLNNKEKKLLIDSFNKYCLFMYDKQYPITVNNLKQYFIELLNHHKSEHVTDLFINYDDLTKTFWYNFSRDSVFYSEIITKAGLSPHVYSLIVKFNNILDNNGKGEYNKNSI